MEREACVCDHGYERSDLCAEITIIIIIKSYGGLHEEDVDRQTLFPLYFWSTRDHS